MASKVVDEYLKNLPKTQQAEITQAAQGIQRSGVEPKSPAEDLLKKLPQQADIAKAGQGLQRNGAEIKDSAYQPSAFPRRAEIARPNAPEPKATEAPALSQESKSGQQKKMNAVDRALASTDKPKAIEQGHQLQKNNVSFDKGPER